MKNNKAALKRQKRKECNGDRQVAWSQLPYDILLHILSMVSVVDRLIHVAAVCRTWRAAVSDPIFSRALDISKCRELLTTLHLDDQNMILELAFVRGINLGLANLTKLVFDSQFPVTDSHLLYAASSCPNLRELVLLNLNWISTQEALRDAFQCWKQLQSLFVEWRLGARDIFAIVGQNCPNLTVLKICCRSKLQGKMARSIVTYMRGVKALSLHLGHHLMTGAVKALFSLPNLEQIFIAFHKFRDIHTENVLEDLYPRLAVALQTNPSIQRKISRLRIYQVGWFESQNEADEDHTITATFRVFMGRPMLDNQPVIRQNRPCTCFYLSDAFD